MANAFNFELVSPERLLLSEQVTAVVVPGADGYFTVMANHAPVMATLQAGNRGKPRWLPAARRRFSCAAALPTWPVPLSRCSPKWQSRRKS